jgi:hypothetical protein
MRRSIFLLFALGFLSAASAINLPGGGAFPPPASAPLVIGPLSLRCQPASSGLVVTCIGTLNAVPTIAHTLTPGMPDYDFDVVTPNASAKGKLKAFFMPSDQLSTLEADVTVVPNGQAPVPYRGAFIYWTLAPRRAR